MQPRSRSHGGTRHSRLPMSRPSLATAQRSKTSPRLLAIRDLGDLCAATSGADERSLRAAEAARNPELLERGLVAAEPTVGKKFLHPVANSRQTRLGGFDLSH